ncbi:MAG: type II toxin-antitoxin system PemK/MazF family toxin [Spirochaetia bacterium]|nr:type II toxin-antitoxin system PemK/MazF family toxin [Spirochaetia bacterium]
MNRGEIWWADLNNPRGSEPGYKRPVVIIQANEFNRSKINTIICAVITSNIELQKAPGNIFISKEDSSLSKDSVINISQIITVDKLFLTELAGTLTPGILKKLNKSLKLILNIK